MKIYRYFVISLPVFLLLVSCFLMGNKAGVSMMTQKVEVLAMVASVPTPEYVEFCGQRITLDRFDIKERYDREINSFAYLHSTTMLLIKRANRFFPVIEPVLQRNGVPDDFKYLAVIESNLNIRAYSSAKAAGIWQFLADTGKQYGLEVGTEVDERYHLEKATEAACKYLKDAYAKYGDWPSVAASYNGGMGRISSELSQQNVKTSLDLLLVDETSRYVFRIMAAKEIFSNPYKYGYVLKKEDLYSQIRTNKVEVTANIPDLAAYAQQNGMDYYQLKEINPWLRDRKLTVAGKTKKYYIDLPVVDDLYYSKNNYVVHNPQWVVDE